MRDKNNENGREEKTKEKIETESKGLFRLKRPLGSMATLEDMNSSPARMPLAFAAMASAAFPFGFEPLVLTKYGYDPVKRYVYESLDKLQVSDGGLYDNSGLSTLSELLESIMKVRSERKKKAKLNLVLLSINADADEYNTFYANKVPEQAGRLNKIPFEFGWPIRHKALGIGPLNLIHYVNKRRAEQIAVEKIANIVCSKTDEAETSSKKDADERDNLRCNKDSEKVNFLYFPVNLAQLSPADRNNIRDPSNLYERLKKIPTNFRISDEDEVLIGQAAELLMSSKQEEKGWERGLGHMESPNNKSCKTLRKNLENKINLDLERLDEAFAFYVLCSVAKGNFDNQQ